MARTLSICQVSAAYYPYPSGLSEHVHHLTAALRERGHQVEILTTSFGDDGPPVAGVTRFGRAWLVSLNKSYATVPVGLRLPGQVKRFLIERRFDILHLHGTYPPDISFWALKYARVPTVVTFHTVGFSVNRLSAAIVRRLLGRFNAKLGGRIAETRAAYDFQRQFFPGEYRLIPPGVDTSRFNSRVEPLAALRSDGGPIVLFVGRLDARKGLPVLLRAFAMLRNEIPSARLVAVGRGPQFAECQRLASELGVADRVTFAGFVPTELLPRYYASADVYCSPALGGEAYGIVLVEAMAAGVPVVASDIAGYNEVVRDGVTGLLVPPGESESLAKALVRLLGDAELRARLVKAGQAQVEQVSWPRIAEQVERYYFDIIDQQGSDRRAGCQA